MTRYSFCTLTRRGRIARSRAETITDSGKLLNFRMLVTFSSLLFRVSASEDRRTARRNSEEAIAFFCWLAPPGTIIVTMDVVALYPSIPINDGIAAVMRVLRQHEGSIDLFGFRIGQVKELLAHVLSSNYFRFGAQVYHQKDGVAMGNNLAPPFAILYMHDLESSLLRSAPASPVLYKRYIDDVFIVWNLGPELLQSFLDHFNNADPNIKFTHQSTELTGSINFMDTTVHVSPDGSISYELYRKPCHSGLVSDYNSSVPNQQKKAIASSEFLRAVRLSSDADTLKRSEEKVTNILKFNNFPESVIVSARERAMRPRRVRVQNEYRVTLNLPFHTEYIHNKIHKLLRKYKINAQLIYRNRRLSSMICTSALRKPPCRRYVDPSRPRKRGRPKAACVACMSGSGACTERNVVYHLECRCGDKYVGETYRSLATRTKEHNDDARNTVSGTALGEHFAAKHASDPLPLGATAFSGIRVLGSERDRPRRRIREAINIRERSPEINNNSGWDLL